MTITMVSDQAADLTLLRTGAYVDGLRVEYGEQSGFGREGPVYGIGEYLEMKYLAWEGGGQP